MENIFVVFLVLLGGGGGGGVICVALFGSFKGVTAQMSWIHNKKQLKKMENQKCLMFALQKHL